MFLHDCCIRTVMARFARVVVPGYPYHVTYRGNRREDVFAESEDREVDLAMLQEYSARYAVATVG